MNKIVGEVSEWFKVQHSKCCEQQCSEGSNPSFSVRGSGVFRCLFSLLEKKVEKVAGNEVTYGIYGEIQGAFGGKPEAS